MIEAEATQISKYLSSFEAEQLSPLVEFGSSTIYFRHVVQPFIENDLHHPLRERNIQIITTDLKKGDGIDIHGSIYEDQTIAKLSKIRPRAILCCNILEHLEDRQKFAGLCSQLLDTDGVLIVSVPFDYPFHPDPIDTMYRPLPEEVGQLFSEFRIKFSTIISCDRTYYSDLISMSYIELFRDFFGAISRLILLIARLRFKEVSNNRLFWLFKPYKITIVVLQKSSL